MDGSNVDALLERYLQLLHEYTALREELTHLQSAMYQNLARANFAAERGVRYGQDYYDERMQAGRTVSIACRDGRDIPSYLVSEVALQIDEPQISADQHETTQTEAGEDDGQTPRESLANPGVEDSEPPKKMRKDPLRWFGLLSPMPLRQAQAQSIRVIEDIIPKLASLSSEMAQVEIEVRRARKKRAKAEAGITRKLESNVVV